jgi:FkbM family methyltransferase
MMVRMKERLRRTWVSIKWPLPLWRLRGYASLPVGSEQFRFYGLQRGHYVWALLTHKRRYEPEVTALLDRELRPGDTFLDVGAHIGAFSLLASRRVGSDGGVISLEPDPRSDHLLRLNLRRNGLNATVINWAASDHDGIAHLAGAAGDGTSELKDDGIPVECKTLDSLGVTPDVVKIDVEGGEAAVLRGGAATLRRARCIVIEVHEDKLRGQGEDPEWVLSELRALGRVRRLDQRRADNTNYAVTPSA